MPFTTVGNVEILEGTLWCDNCDNAYNVEDEILCKDCLGSAIASSIENKVIIARDGSRG